MAVASSGIRAVSKREELVEGLAAAMRRGEDQCQPLVIRNPLTVLGKVDLVVIWDRWKGLSYSDRSSIILDACNRSKPGLREQIYTAIGRTTDEAIGLGYLRYRVIPAHHRAKPEEHDHLDAALIEEGAVTTDTGLQLRFHTLDAAQDAFLRLQEKVPGPFWTIVEEVVRDD